MPRLPPGGGQGAPRGSGAGAHGGWAAAAGATLSQRATPGRERPGPVLRGFGFEGGGDRVCLRCRELSRCCSLQFPLPRPASFSSTRSHCGVRAAERAGTQRRLGWNSTFDLRPCESCSVTYSGSSVCFLSKLEDGDLLCDPALSAAPVRGYTCPRVFGFLFWLPTSNCEGARVPRLCSEDTCLSPSAAAGFRTPGSHLVMMCSDGNDLVRSASKNILYSILHWAVGQGKRASCCEYSEKASEVGF